MIAEVALVLFFHAAPDRSGASWTLVGIETIGFRALSIALRA
jgi:hypothetical protein